ncbi:MAG: sigma-70 family RNA polymerase sigma factor [Phycisphaerales bacterium]|nr:sigma-70 family RNA polymerase sigma factor [Phycisphaerales bacterium]
MNPLEQPASQAHARGSPIVESILPLYQQLRAIAQARLAGGGREVATLQATAVVHEALLRLADRPLESFSDDRHLLATAAQAIRHVVVDHARRKRSLKRDVGRNIGGTADGDAIEHAVGLDDPAKVHLVIDLDDAMAKLADIDPELRTIVELHAFGGMEHAEVAALLGMSERTVRRRWQFAAARLRMHLHDWSEVSDDLADE